MSLILIDAGVTVGLRTAGSRSPLRWAWGMVADDLVYALYAAGTVWLLRSS